MKNSAASRLRHLTAAVLVAGLLIAGVLLYRRWAQQKKGQTQISTPKRIVSPPEKQYEGLSEVKAAARLEEIDLKKFYRADERRFLFRAIRKNLVTIYNIDLFSIAILMYVLGNPLSSLGALAVLLVALILNVFQETYTKKKLNRIVRSISPQAAVIRDGHIKSIDPILVVEEDLLILRPGDHVLVRGVVFGQGQATLEKVSGQESKQFLAREGDALNTDEYCVEGHVVYQALESGMQARLEPASSKVELLQDEKTPIQQLLNRIFMALFAVVLAFSAALFIDAVIVGAEIVSSEYRDGFSVILGVAPTSLFLVLIVQYAMGTFRVAEAGALVYQSDSIESLANVSTICFSHQSLTSGLQVALEPITDTNEQEPLSENLVRHMLGDILHSSPAITRELRQLAESFPGTAYPVLDLVPYLPNNGWYAASFDEPDLRGTYVIGDPQMLEPHLSRPEISLGQEAQELAGETGRGLQHWVRQRATRITQRNSEAGGFSGDSTAVLDHPLSETSISPNRRKRLGSWVRGLLVPIEEKGDQGAGPHEWEGSVELLFAYQPNPVPLYDEYSLPKLPESLIPLSILHIADSIRPEILEVLSELVDQKMKLKILSSDSPERAITTVSQLGLDAAQIIQQSGPSLTSLDKGAFDQAVREAQVLGDLTPHQKSAVVESLRGAGEYVAVMGHDTTDVLAMKQANLRLALKSGTQAALKLTDIVLLEDSMQALPTVLAMGQRLVSGVLDTFKLYLSQVGAQFLLLLYVLIFSLDRFPIHPTHSGVVNAFTIAVPNILLALWSAGGRLTQEKVRRQLAHFIIPSSIFLSFLAMGVFAIFSNRDPGAGYPPQDLVEPLKLSGPQPFYVELAVTYSLLFAGWVRVLFLQPPTRFWVGGAPLRGDRRIYSLVLASIGVYIFVLLFPLLPLQEWLRITWLPSVRDYILIAGAVAVWAIVLRTIWRLRWKATYSEPINAGVDADRVETV